jgi:hypothetical protein
MRGHSGVGGHHTGGVRVRRFDADAVRVGSGGPQDELTDQGGRQPQNEAEEQSPSEQGPGFRGDAVHSQSCRARGLVTRRR